MRWWVAIYGCDSSDFGPGLLVTTPPSCFPAPGLDVVGDGVDSDCDGSDAGSEPLDVATTSTVPERNLQFGYALATGDVDVDGDGEILVGSQEYDWRPDYLREVEPSDNGQVSLLDGDGFAELGLWHGVGADHFGRSVGLGDVSGDGRVDLVMGGADRVVVLAGEPFPALRDGDAVLALGEIALGTWIWVADVIGDPTADLIVSAGDYTGVGQRLQLRVFAGPLTGSTDLSLADLVVGGASDSVVVADFDGDGIPDLAAGDRSGDESLYLGPLVAPVVVVADADGVWTGDSPLDWFAGYATSGDLDRDGLPELIVAAAAWPDNDRIGRVYVLDPFETEPVAILDGEQPGQFFGRSLVCADLDGDGETDLAVGAPDEPHRGRVAIFVEPPLGHRTAADADLAFSGESVGGGAGFSLAAADVDGDGFQDLVVGAPFVAEAGLENVGRVYLLAGPLELP